MDENQYGRRCPKCGSGNAIVVNAVLWVPILLGKEGVGDSFFGPNARTPDDAEWEPESNCWCDTCRWNGRYEELLHGQT